MDPIDIRYLLSKNGLSQVDIARKLKITRQVVCMVINNRKKSRRVRRAIARAIGKRVFDIWPDAA